MGGSSQPWMGATPDQTGAVQQAAQPQTTSGYSSDIANPAAMPINSANAPGSTADLENIVAQGPRLWQQQPQQPQTQPDPNVEIAARMQKHAQIPPNPPQLSAE